MLVQNLGELVHKLCSDPSIPQSRKDMTRTACGYVLKATNAVSVEAISVNRIVPALNKLKPYLVKSDLVKRSQTNYISFYKRLIEYGILNGLLPNKLQKSMLNEWIGISEPVKGISPGEKGWRYAMRILAWYSSKYNVRPQDLTVTFIEDFLEFLEHEYGIKDWRQIYNRIVRYWNELESSNEVPNLEWPKLPSGQKNKYGLNFEDWPGNTQKEFVEYKLWCTAKFRSDRKRRYHQRDVSVEQNISTTSRIFGFAVNIDGYNIDQISSNLLFDKKFINSFFDWYINERLGRLTVTAERTVAMLLSMARGHFNKPEAVPWLLEIKFSIGHPKPVKNKKDFILTMQELGCVGNGIRERRLREISNAKKRNTKPSPRHNSSLVRDELVFRLLSRRPLRSRNIREMKLGKNLKNDDGTWNIEYSSDEMKNNDSFRISFPKDLVPLLEDYLENYRKNIFVGPSCEWVFPSPNGTHICASTVQRIVTKNCQRILNKHIYPHLMRDMVAYWYIKETGDYLTVSKLLGHKDVNMTVRLYSNFDANDAAEKYDAFFLKNNTTNEDNHEK